MKLYLSPKASFQYQALKSKSVPYAEQVKAILRIFRRIHWRG